MRHRAVRILCVWGMLGIMSVFLVADTTYYWKPDYEAATFLWSFCANWSYVGDEPQTCYPLNSVQHHATVPFDDVTYIIYLTKPPGSSFTNSFGDWIVQDDVTLRNGSGTVRVDYLVKSFEIQGGTNGSVVKIEKKPAGTCDNCCLTIRTSTACVPDEPDLCGAL